jgi:hypothetical protein
MGHAKNRGMMGMRMKGQKITNQKERDYEKNI